MNGCLTILLIIILLSLIKAYFPAIISLFLIYLIWKYKYKQEKKDIIITIILSIIIIISIFNPIKIDKSKDINETSIKETKVMNNKLYLKSTEPSEEIETIEESYSELSKENTNNMLSIIGKYSINNLLKNYNQIAEYPIVINTNSKRPIERATITLENGVYVILTYNDYNNTLFIDYQEEAYNDLTIYPIFRDFIKSINLKITDEEIDIGWKELQTGNYQYYTEYNLKGIKCTYSMQKLNNGQIRYYIQTLYKHQ